MTAKPTVTPRTIAVTRVFDAPVELVWRAWVEPQAVMRWWGPDHYTCPSAVMDFREGGTSVVAMRSPEGVSHYSAWKYRKIVPHQVIEFIQSLSTPDGLPIDPVSVGMPADFPLEIRTVVVFKALGSQTEMTVTEYDFTAQGQMYEYAVLGLNQTVDKLGAALTAL
jgi:uncharacterized protein YndB with AHSA1/START domain